MGCVRSKPKSSHSCRSCGLRKFPSLNHVPKISFQETCTNPSRDIFSVAHKMSFLDTTAEEDITISDPEPSKRLKNNDGSSISTSTNVRDNIFVAEHKVSRMQRGVSHDIERKFRGCVAWFTGLSGAGKSTVSMGVEKELVSRGIRYVQFNSPLQFDDFFFTLF